jgi:uncharacterized protein YukJ
MPIDNYGIWVARPVRVSAERAEQDPDTPHIHLFYDDGTGGKFDNARRASINVKSGSKLSELVFWKIENFLHPLTNGLRGLNHGFHPVLSKPGGLALDYIRSNVIDFPKGRILPHDQPGMQDDIIDFIMPELQAAINRNATIYLFGEPYSDQEGIHNIHMNQGSQAQFRKYNGVWQDGAVVIYYPDENLFTAIFLAFASQAVHTDEIEGHGLPGSQNFAQLLSSEVIIKPEIADDIRVAIVAALVNPIGTENQPDATGRPEMVYLLNRSTTGISLGGWSLLNKNDESHVISNDIWLAPGEVRPVVMGQVTLSNKGGLISLLDQNGYKVDGVSYTKEQADKDGEMVIFR